MKRKFTFWGTAINIATQRVPSIQCADELMEIPAVCCSM